MNYPSPKKSLERCSYRIIMSVLYSSHSDRPATIPSHGLRNSGLFQNFLFGQNSAGCFGWLKRLPFFPMMKSGAPSVDLCMYVSIYYRISIS